MPFICTDGLPKPPDTATKIVCVLKQQAIAQNTVKQRDPSSIRSPYFTLLIPDILDWTLFENALMASSITPQVQYYIRFGTRTASVKSFWLFVL